MSDRYLAQVQNILWNSILSLNIGPRRNFTSWCQCFSNKKSTISEKPKFSRCLSERWKLLLFH